MNQCRFIIIIIILISYMCTEILRLRYAHWQARNDRSLQGSLWYCPVWTGCVHQVRMTCNACCQLSTYLLIGCGIDRSLQFVECHLSPRNPVGGGGHVTVCCCGSPIKPVPDFDDHNEHSHEVLVGAAALNLIEAHVVGALPVAAEEPHSWGKQRLQ